MSDHALRPVDTLARYALHNASRQASSRVRLAAHAVLGNPIYDAAHKLLAACRDHGLPMRQGDLRPNPYGTFSDAMRNLASALPAEMSRWSVWLRNKAQALDAVIARAEGTSVKMEETNDGPA